MKITPEIMADLTVKIAKVIRDSGIDECRFNESLNCLQMAIAEEYLEEWAGLEVPVEYGAYDYWEAAHKRTGITRPGG